MKEVVALRPSIYRYLTDGGYVDKKKHKGHKEICNQMGNKVRELENMSGK